MAEQLLVSISRTAVSLAHWRGRGFRAVTTFSNDDAGRATFAAALKRARRVPVQIVVDAVEEDYRYETLPHAHGRDRAELIGRKLRQLYRGTPYCAAVPRGRDEGAKRRDDRYLFLALTNPDAIAPWVKAIEGTGLPVAGVYLLPMAGETLIERLQLTSANLVGIARVSAGLRLSFFRERQLRLSRLVPIEGDGLPPTAVLAEEINNTRYYMNTLRLIGLDEPLTVVMLDARDELGAAAQELARDQASLDVQRIGRAELARKLGLAPAMLDHAREALVLHTVGLKTPAGNLAPAVVTAGFKSLQVRRGLYALAGAVAAITVVWAAINAALTLTATFETERQRTEAARQQTAYVEVTRKFPSAPASSDNLQRTVELSRQLIASLRSPEPFLVTVSHALDANPSVYLRSVTWKYGASDADAGGATTTPPPAAAPSGRRRQSGVIEGEIRPFRGDYRAAIDAINRLAQTLAKDPAVEEVRVTQLPLNISPDLPLSGNTVDERDRTGASAQFKLMVILRAEAT